MFIKLKNRGDTIIEVLLALSVLGTIIGGGYSVATRSLNGVRISQERSEATKIAEGQLEALKATFSQYDTFAELFQGYNGFQVTNDPSKPIPIGVNSTWTPAYGPGITEMGFCFDGVGDVHRFTRPAGGIQDLTGTEYTNAGCVYGYYHVYIDTNYAQVYNNGFGTVVSQFTYYVNVTWEKSGGGVVEHLVLNDRVLFGI